MSLDVHLTSGRHGVKMNSPLERIAFVKIEYQRIALRPYPGEILLFKRLNSLRAKYTTMTGDAYPYVDEVTGGRFVLVRKGTKRSWLVYARRPHVKAHEFLHVLLATFSECGIDPIEANGEPLCYMLSQLLLEAA